MDRNRELISKFSLVIKIIYLLAVSGLIFQSFASYVYDDPFITYRYADNLRSGLGFVYNPNERVLSTTTPLFTILFGLLGIIWKDTHLLANFIGALSIAIGGLLLWDLGQSLKAPVVSWTGLLLYPTFPLLLSTLSSETPLFLSLVLGTFVFYARKKISWAVFLAGLAILTRSDGILVVAILGCHYIWIQRNQLNKRIFWQTQPWLSVGITLGLLIAWHGFAWYYFGSPLPVTLAAKQAQGRMAISQHFAPGALRVWGWYSSSWQNWVELILVGIGLMNVLLKNRSWLLILGWSGLYFLMYSLLGVTSYFWYYAPLVPGWVISVGLGITFIAGLLPPKSLQRINKMEKIRIGIIALLIFTLFLTQFINFFALSHTTDSRYKIYRAVGEWLAANTPIDVKVGALEIGIIGYYSQRKMVDFAGLIQPGVADVMNEETTYNDTAVWAIKAYQPEYLVMVKPNPQSRIVNEIIEPYCKFVQGFAGSDFEYRSDFHVFNCQYE